MTSQDSVIKLETNSEQLKKQSRRQPKVLTKEQFLSVQHLSQEEAAQALDVCLSTFKRQLRTSGMRWKTPSERRHIVHSQSLRERIYKVLEEIESCEQNMEHQYQITSRQLQLECLPNLKITDDFEIEFMDTNTKSNHNLANKDLLSEIRYLRTLCKYQHKFISKLSHMIIPQPYKTASKYNGDLSIIPGPWTPILTSNPHAAINLFTLNLDIIATSIGYRQLTQWSERELYQGKTIKDSMTSSIPDLSYIFLWTKLLEGGRKQVQLTDTLKRMDGTIISVSITIHFMREFSLIWAIFEEVPTLSPILRIDSKIINSPDISDMQRNSQEPYFVEKIHTAMFEILDEHNGEQK